MDITLAQGLDGARRSPAGRPLHTREAQQGNQLFKLRDHAAASEEYAAGLRALRLEVSTGARCLVKPVEGGSKVRGAMVTFLDEDAATADLLYEATSRPLQP